MKSVLKISVTASLSVIGQRADPDVKQRRPSHRVTFSMGHAGASRTSPNDAPWEKLSQRFCNPSHWS